MKWSIASPLKIAIVDDHSVIRNALRFYLSMEPDFKVVSTYASSGELISALRTTQIDILVLDYQLSDGELDGLRLIKLLRNRYPELRILIFSAHDKPGLINMTIRAGANGFFEKTGETEELSVAIRTVALNRLYLSPAMSAILTNTPAPEAVDGADALVNYPSLTPKEREVLRCCLGGMSVSQIANKFLRSRKTISGQKQAAMKKLHISTDSELFKLSEQLKDL